MSDWAVVVAAGVATFSLRFVFIGLFGRFSVPAWLERPLRYVAPAVLAALSIPAIAAPTGNIEFWGPLLPAAVVAGIVAWRSKSLGTSILAGLVALWIIQAVT